MIRGGKRSGGPHAQSWFLRQRQSIDEGLDGCIGRQADMLLNAMVVQANMFGYLALLPLKYI
jgi:hypothetical protein